jgi:hypothetical protein
MRLMRLLRTRVSAQSLVWIALAIVLVPMAVGGFPIGTDWLHELVRVSEYRSALADGQLPPAWAPNLYAGYGSPIFLFYSPLFLFVASGLTAVSGSVLLGSSIALMVFGVIAVVAMGRLAAAALGAERTVAARVSIYLFVLNPYLIGDLLLRNANAEFAALCLAPLPLAGVLIAEKRPARAIWIVGAGLALVVLTHSLTALAVQTMVMIGAVLLHGARRPRALGSVLVGVVWGMALSAFLWVPAMALRPLIRPDELLTGKFDFHSQFVSPLSIYGYAELYGAGLIPGCVLLAAAAAAWRSPDASIRRLLMLCLGGSVALILMMTRLSTPLWETIPLMHFFQFPWRMQGSLAVLTALIGGLAFAEFCRRWPERVVWPAELALFALCVLNALPHLLEYRGVSQSDRAGLERSLAPEAIRAAVMTATVGDEYLPRSARKPTAADVRAPADPIASYNRPTTVDVLRNTGTTSDVRLTATEPTRVKLRRWHFPGWRPELDARPAPARKTRTGAMAIEVPPGTHELSLTYLAPPVRRIATWVSLLALLGPLACWIGAAFRGRVGSGSAASTPRE